MPPPAAPLVSCVCVTPPARARLLAQAVAGYAAQTWPRRELVVVVDGPPEPTAAAVRSLVPDAVVAGWDGPPGLIGAIRNRGLDLARGDLVCHWDDDDLYDPDRVRVQAGALLAARADASYLAEQLHWRVPDRAVSVFRHRPIWGTLMHRADPAVRFAPVRLHDDTEIYHRVFRRRRVATVNGSAGLLCRRFHGANANGLAHFRAVAKEHGVPAAEVAARRAELEAACRALGVSDPAGLSVGGPDGEAFRLPPGPAGCPDGEDTSDRRDGP